MGKGWIPECRSPSVPIISTSSLLAGGFMPWRWFSSPNPTVFLLRSLGVHQEPPSFMRWEKKKKKPHPVSVCPDTNRDRCRDGVGGCGAQESKAKASRRSDYPSKNTSGRVAMVNKSYLNPPVHFLRWKYMRLNSSPPTSRREVWPRSATLPFSEEKSLRKEF